MQTATMEEVQAHLPELLGQLALGDEMVITRDGESVARLLPTFPVGVAVPGRGRGKLIILSDDDEHLADFAEYT